MSYCAYEIKRITRELEGSSKFSHTRTGLKVTLTLLAFLQYYGGRICLHKKYTSSVIIQSLLSYILHVPFEMHTLHYMIILVRNF